MRRRLLPLLQVLLLLYVFLRQLLSLLLVLLFDLLVSRVVRFLLLQALVFLVLFLLELLALLILFSLQLVLLLLVFLVEIRIARVWRCGAFAARKVVGVHDIVRACATIVLRPRGVVFRTHVFGAVIFRPRRRLMHRAAFARRHCSAAS